MKHGPEARRGTVKGQPVDHSRDGDQHGRNATLHDRANPAISWRWRAVEADDIKCQMPGERTGQRFRSGDHVCVRRVRADLERKEIDSVPVDDKLSRKTARPAR